MSVEVAIERSFYYNLTLGIIERLENNEDVIVRMNPQKPSDLESVTVWEQRNGCVLPIDLKNFYLSLDGFELTWSYSRGGETINIGNMHINKLNDFKRIFKNKSEVDDTESLDEIIEIFEKEKHTVDNSRPSFCNKNCKIFVLEETITVGAICAVFMGKIPEVHIWLLDFSYEWHILASSFSQYFRMMIYYQGAPEWQFIFTPYSLSPWAEQLMCTVTPQLCFQHSSPKAWEPATVQLDPNLFKTKSKQTKQYRYSADESQLDLLKI